jgi:multicomponent Na+:H+ antiporter subunit A
MTQLLLLNAVVAFVVFALGPHLRRHAFRVAALAPAGIAVYAAVAWPDAMAGEARIEEIAWVPGLDLALSFRVDAFAVLFLAVIGVAGTAIFWYAARYFSPGTRVYRFAGTMTLFAGSMAGLVASDHLLSLFVFWELTTVTSYLLIGYDDHSARARSAALHAAVVTGLGGLAMLGGLVILGNAAGSFLISEITAASTLTGAAVDAAWALILLGAVTKSAQFPFHGWLPGAMAAPTPASAFLHSATMVKAGIFLVGRLGFTAADGVTWWRPAILVIGVITMAVGAWQALRQTDLKLLLAHGTVSQLGFMFLLIGSGSTKLLYGGLALLAAHALFKAALFLVVGTIDHETGTRDITRLTGLRRSMPLTFATAVAASLSMAALPLTFGFAAKEAAFDGLVGEGGILIGAAAALSVLTVAYTGRFLIGAFGSVRSDQPDAAAASRPGTLLVLPAAAITVLSLVLGFAPGLLEGAVGAATEAAGGIEGSGKLVVWPGLVEALAWSMVSLGLGLAAIAARDRLERLVTAARKVTGRVPSPQDVFSSSIRGLLAFADRVTGTVQHGSLPAYAATILLIAVGAPTVGALTASTSLALPPAGTAGQAILGVIVLASAIGLAFVRRRFAAVILLGAVGYGVAGLFAVAGGPDLALTQLLVETLAVALFALVLRHLPARFPRVFARIWRVAVGAAVGVFVLGAGLVVTAARPSTAVADGYLQASVPEADGANVVNTILVDFRALDTLGEIAVVAVAAIGAAGLVAPVLRRSAGRRADG